MPGLGELHERSGITRFFAIEPQVAAETIPGPIGACGFNHNSTAVRSQAHIWNVHGIEKLVESQRWFVARLLGHSGGTKQNQDQGALQLKTHGHDLNKRPDNLNLTCLITSFS